MLRRVSTNKPTNECSSDGFQPGVIIVCASFQGFEDSILISLLSARGSEINSHADSTLLHFTCKESFEEEAIFADGMCFTSQELKRRLPHITSVLYGRSSPLKSSWNADDLEERKEVLGEQSYCWERQAEEILEELTELGEFFSRGN